MKRCSENSLSSVAEGEESDEAQEPEDEDEINAFSKHLGMDPERDAVRLIMARRCRRSFRWHGQVLH